MRKNEIKAELKFGHYTYFITVKDTGKGVVALGKTKDAFGTAAVCGATAAAIGAVAACPILIAALPIAAILTGGFGRDTRR